MRVPHAAPVGEADGATAWPPALEGDLRSDHAGETGAVMIYRGILAVARDPDLLRFAAAHLDTERRHLEAIEAVLPPGRRSALLPLWRVAGFATGFLPALAGPRAVYATIEAVETFVDGHYAAQTRRIDSLDAAGTDPRLQRLRALIETCREDEVHHRDDATARLASAPPRSRVLAAWTRLVGAGSGAAVALCRRW